MILDYPLTACLQQVGVGLYQKNNQFLIHFWMKMKSFRDYLGLSNSCSYDVDDVIGRADRFGFQNFCSPASYRRAKNDTDILQENILPMICQLELLAAVETRVLIGSAFKMRMQPFPHSSDATHKI